MVGITGYLGIKDKTLLNKMIDSLRYTNKELSDIYGSREISISRVHHGIIDSEKQPIFNEDKSIFIVMEGEVFDYENEKNDLIKKGHKFKLKNNSAEFCLHLYEEYGDDTFEKLNGSFLITLYDLKNKELIFVTDKLGWYPFFYYINDKKFIFGTQMSSILQDGEFERHLNIDSIHEFFTFQRVFGDNTFYKNIKISLPATIMKIKSYKIKTKCYWKMDFTSEEHDEDYWADELASALKKAINIRLNKRDYKFGILLGGGLDARAILAGADKNVTCFTYGTYKNNEFTFGDMTAKIKKSKHVFFQIDKNHFANLADVSIRIGDGMHPFIHAPWIGYFEEIKKDCNVLLHGFSFDILFRGLFVPMERRSFLGRNVSIRSIDYTWAENNFLDKLIKEANYGLQGLNPAQLFKDKNNVNNNLKENFTKVLESRENGIKNLYDRVDHFWIDSLYRYPSFLNVSCIRPFVDEMLVTIDPLLLDVYLRMPPEARINDRIWKKTLIKLNKDVGEVPDAKTGFSPLLPKSLEHGIVLSRKLAHKIMYKILNKINPKQRKESNFAELIRYNKKFREKMYNIINDPKAINPKIFDVENINKMFKLHINGKEDHNTAFFIALLTFGRWHKIYGPT
ncbi:hypothetical protein HYV89_04295 [Candidatus Woesearchaeota archaeon]|nr:hypothetical protein [Candidatus Woesearchaeota archaeon]